MSFISDLLIEISSFRIRVGNKLNALANRIGELTALTTSNKTDIVGAINEVDGKTSALDNIGGRNLANPGGYSNNYLSSFFYSGDFGSRWQIVNINGQDWVKKISLNNGRLAATLALKPNTTYTWSADAWIDPIDGTSATFNWSAYDGGIYSSTSIVVNNVPRRIFHTFTTKTTTYYDLPHIG